MELRSLAYFVAVAEEGSFVRAAERLHIVQPAVSQQVRRLEAELGVRLFDRSSRRVRLTGAGERLLPAAHAALAAAEEVRRTAADITRGEDGVLRIGTAEGLTSRLHRILAELARRAPRLTVRLSRMAVTERLDAVRAGSLDAAFVRALRTAPGLELAPVGTDPLLAALPAAHPLAERLEPALTELAALPLRLAPRERNPAFYDLVLTVLEEAGAEPERGAPFTTLQDTAAEIATGSPAWTLFYVAPEDLPALPGVAVRPVAGHAVPISLATAPGTPAPAVRRLREACAAAR